MVSVMDFSAGGWWISDDTGFPKKGSPMKGATMLATLRSLGGDALVQSPGSRQRQPLFGIAVQDIEIPAQLNVLFCTVFSSCLAIFFCCAGLIPSASLVRAAKCLFSAEAKLTSGYCPKVSVQRLSAKRRSKRHDLPPVG